MPAAHASQAVRPRAEAYFPAAQRAHWEPRDAWNLPGRHAWQLRYDLAPVRVAYFPARHRMQWSLPFLGWNVPRSQRRGCWEPEGQYCPALQICLLEGVLQ